MWTVAGHDAAVTQLQRAIQQGRLAHAHLFVGPRHVGKMALALNLAQALNCTPAANMFGETPEKPCQTCAHCRRIAEGKHSDVMTLAVPKVVVPPPPGKREGSQKKEIGIDQVKELQRQASLKPFEGAWHVFIVDGAEYLSGEAANRLLKTLEEPPEQALLLLLAVDERSVLPTITSRCRKTALDLVPRHVIATHLQQRCGQDEATARKLAALCGGAIGWAIAAAQDPTMLTRRDERLQPLARLVEEDIDERFSQAGQLASAYSRDREEMKERLALWQGWWRDLLLVQQGLDEQVTNVDALDALRIQAKALTREQLAKGLMGIERVWQDLEQNANPRLALEVLMLDLPKVRVEKAMAE